MAESTGIALVSMLAAIDEQIAALNGRANIEYLIRQRDYLRSQVELSGITLDYAQLGQAIADNISPTTEEKLQLGKTLIVTGSGETPIAHSVTVCNIGDAPGTLAGAPLLPGDGGKTFSAATGRLLAPILYDATGTSFDISYVIDAT